MRKTGPSLETKYLVIERAGAMCEKCGRIAVDVHHRKPRRMGGSRDPEINSPANLVLLCRDCHNWVESNRAQAMVEGWLLYASAPPGDTPVFMGAGWIYLKHDGSYETREDGKRAFPG